MLLKALLEIRIVAFASPGNYTHDFINVEARGASLTNILERARLTLLDRVYSLIKSLKLFFSLLSD